MRNRNVYEYKHFQNTFAHILDKHAPIKKKLLRFTNNNIMKKTSRKAITYRSKVKSVDHKSRANENWASYKKQRSVSVNLRKTKKDYFQGLAKCNRFIW